MLRFIRKFQLLILVVGGSLLMVVFLLQPILTRLSPSPMKAKVATLEDGSKYLRLDIQHANSALSLLKRVYPRAFAPRAAGGLGLDQSDESTVALHWLLLVKQAEKAGFIGEVGDGVSWVNELADFEARIQLNNEIQQRLISSDQEAIERLNELTPLIANSIHTNAQRSAGFAGGTVDDVYRILAQARGVRRLLTQFQTMPSFSDVNAIRAAHEALDAVAIDAAVFDSSLAQALIPEPSDEQLQAFFDTYKAQAPEDNDFQIGYTQPTRIQIGWLTLDQNVFMNAVKLDRTAMSKMYQLNRDTYPGEYVDEKLSVERQYREETAAKMMAEADRIIRAQIITVTNGLPKVNGILTLPEDWDSRRPSLEEMAETAAEQVNEEFSSSLPIPSVTIIGDRWLNANDVAALPGFGSSTYQIGSRPLPAGLLPSFFELTGPNTIGLDVQVGLPLVDPAAADQIGNRYYSVILGMRPKGPADSIEDLTRERVLSDYNAIQAYQTLIAKADEFRSAIESDGKVDSAIELVVALSPSDDPESTPTPRPSVVKNVLVRRDSIRPSNQFTFVDPRLNTEPFRQAVLDSASTLAPLSTPDAIAEHPVSVVVGLPGSRSVGVSLVVAPRPVSTEDFQTQARAIVRNGMQLDLNKATTGQQDPFSYDALSKRYGLIRIKNDDDEDSPAQDEPENGEESVEDSE